MRLTTRGRYAVTAMLDLALHNSTGPVSLGDISERQSISLSYLEQLFARLRRSGLVVSARGPGGGYTLSREAETIAVSDIIDAVDEAVDATRCGGNSDCHDNHQCLTHDLWTELNRQIRRFLMGVTLYDLMQRKGLRDATVLLENRVIPITAKVV
ncbi:MAG: Rrf2 family transcriptional regulator [Thiotrichales bacterium]